MMELKIARSDNTRPPCRHVFRYRRNEFASNGRIVFSDEWRLMKRLSCDGSCMKDRVGCRCYSPFDDVEEGGIENLQINLPKHPKDGELYQAIFVPGPPDLETGYMEDWEWNMVPYVPETADAEVG